MNINHVKEGNDVFIHFSLFLSRDFIIIKKQIKGKNV